MARPTSITCPKCGCENHNPKSRVTWHAGDDPCSYPRSIDHLHGQCILCRYDGIEFVFSPRDRAVGWD